MQKAAARLTHGILLRMLESFVIHARIRKIFAGIDSTGLSWSGIILYKTRQTTKEICQNLNLCRYEAANNMGIKIWHRRRHDSVDFVPLLERAVRLAPIRIAVADRGYDSEQNHVSAQNIGISNSIIRPKYESVQVYKTKGFHRKQMKQYFDWESYHQRSKIEAIFSVIKRMLGEYVMSRYILTQYRETMYRMIAYNCYRLNTDVLEIWMVSTGPI